MRTTPVAATPRLWAPCPPWCIRDFDDGVYEAEVPLEDQSRYHHGDEQRLVVVDQNGARGPNKDEIATQIAQFDEAGQAGEPRITLVISGMSCIGLNADDAERVARLLLWSATMARTGKGRTGGPESHAHLNNKAPRCDLDGPPRV